MVYLPSLIKITGVRTNGKRNPGMSRSIVYLGGQVYIFGPVA